MKTLAAIQYFLDNRRAQNLRPTTIDWYSALLGKFAQACPELAKEPLKIEVFLAGLVSLKRSEQTIHDYFAALRAFFRFLADRYNVPNPMAKIRSPRCRKKLRATLEPSEVWRILYAATNLRDKTLLTLIADNGIRSGELRSLRKRHIRTDTVTVYGKCGEREVPITEETRRLLLSLTANIGQDDYVFQGHKGPLGRHGVYQMVRKYMRQAGISGPKLGSHRIRHGFGKNFLVSGGDLRSLQLIMGHTNITTTEEYTALTSSDILAKHRQFNLLRAAHAAAQESFLDNSGVLKEAEEILKGEQK